MKNKRSLHHFTKALIEFIGDIFEYVEDRKNE